MKWEKRRKGQVHFLTVLRLRVKIEMKIIALFVTDGNVENHGGAKSENVRRQSAEPTVWAHLTVCRLSAPIFCFKEVVL